MSKLQIIIGSTRPTRAADKVAPWVIERATSHPTFDVEVLDLRDWPLPMFAEHQGSIGDFNDPTYSDPAVKRWNQKIKAADAYLVITPEYNHSVPGVLKNAIDNIFVSFAFRNKPLVTVGYSGGIAGGVRAIEHLAQIAIEAELVPLRAAVVIPQVAEAFDESGLPINPIADISLGVALDDLAWWSAALERARAAGELVPSAFRVQAAAAAVNEIEDEAV
ncbi:MAG TPA: NAD(P)H-dependent oxidoreductase [Acidimicrobiales bacterium]|jgi:NAD(P)H-dependent FMN reductase|nr:NAD(P)H-dependent oxidoreductase [Acidimicrobiales bacterium]